jgi:hypothetical protein
MRTTIPGYTADAALWGRAASSTTALVAADVLTSDDNPNAITPQLVSMTCPNQSLQVICSLASAPAQGACWWLGWNHGAEVGCVQGITLAHMPWCTPCSFT